MVLFGVFAAVAVEVTSQPSFCNSCHIMNSFYDSWKASSHTQVNCLDCHLQPGFAGYVKGKINGLAQAVDCMVGRVGTKPNAAIKDGSCLRAECHNMSELAAKNTKYGSIAFSHQHHAGKVVGGIKISCGTCHSHFEGTDHFSVNAQACHTCHFLDSNEGTGRLVEVGCRDCHEVPTKVIKRGLVEINHSEFVSYTTNCEDSCHKKQTYKKNDVGAAVCLSCHSARNDGEVNSVELHTLHTSGEKVECFGCHGEIEHGAMQGTTVAAMMDCTNCHSDTHGIQQTIYTAEYHLQQVQSERTLSPMFLTHVECIGCHIERVPKKSATLDSFGTVAKAVPRACDNCHEEGTGQQYVRFWQNKIKGLYKDVAKKIDQLEERAQAEADRQSKQGLYDKINQARSILESVSSDGSWGVHNFKYTEAMLLKANSIVTK
jgi:nitrate/TMAO reductase-like tetraheme cytochrome c subunit